MKDLAVDAEPAPLTIDATLDTAQRLKKAVAVLPLKRVEVVSPTGRLQVAEMQHTLTVTGDPRDDAAVALSMGLFDVVGHLNSAGDLVSDPEERLSLARMSLEAAGRAEDSAAFGAALRYLTLGLLRLPEDAWASQYPLRLRYAMKTGLMLSLSGQHDEALAILSDCEGRTASRLDLTEVLVVLRGRADASDELVDGGGGGVERRTFAGHRSFLPLDQAGLARIAPAPAPPSGTTRAFRRRGRRNRSGAAGARPLD